MSTSSTVEERLRDNDIFELFLDLLNKEKRSAELAAINFDSIILNIELIRNKLNKSFSVGDYKFEANPLIKIDYNSILFNIYASHSRYNRTISIGLHRKRSGIVRDKRFRYFISKNEDYLNKKLEETYNIYLRNSITLVLEKYLNFFEAFGFIRDEVFNDKFASYIKYILNILEKIDQFNEDSYKKLPTILFNILKPFFIKKFLLKNSNNQNALISIESKSTEITNLYKYVSTGDIFYLTRDLSKSDLNDYKLIIFNATDLRFDKDILVHIKSINSLDFDLEITVGKSGESKQSDLFFSLFLITKSIESIQGITLSLKDISKGSINGKFKGKLKDIVAKEEFKTVVRNGAEIAGKILADTSFSETGKTYAETEKTKLESQTLQQQIDAALSIEDQKYKNQLSVEKDIIENQKSEAQLRLLEKDEKLKDIEIQQKEIDLRMKQIQYIKELSQLLSQGIISADILNVSLNGLPIIIKSNGKLEVGDIDEAMK